MEVRRMSAKVLGLFGEYAKKAIPALNKALKDPYPSVRQAAKIALGQIQVAPPDPNAPIQPGKLILKQQTRRYKLRRKKTKKRIVVPRKTVVKKSKKKSSTSKPIPDLGEE